MAAPFLWLGASPVLAYNLVLLAGFTLTAWASTLVVARWTGDWTIAILAGTFAGFNAHTISRLPHLQAQHGEFLPLSLLALDALLREPRVGHALEAGGLVRAAVADVGLPSRFYRLRVDRSGARSSTGLDRFDESGRDDRAGGSGGRSRAVAVSAAVLAGVPGAGAGSLAGGCRSSIPRRGPTTSPLPDVCTTGSGATGWHRSRRFFRDSRRWRWPASRSLPESRGVTNVPGCAWP